MGVHLGDDLIISKFIKNRHNKSRKALPTYEGSTASIRPLTITRAVHTFLIRDEVTLYKCTCKVLLDGLKSSAKSLPKPDNAEVQRPEFCRPAYLGAEAFHRQAKARANRQPGTMVLFILTSLGEVLHI